MLGGEFGIRVRKNVQVVVEGGWFKDVVTDSRIVELASFATYLQQTQGLPATAEIDAPAWFGTVGLRYIFENSSGVPAVLANAGVARVEYRPSFTLNNQPISSNVIRCGITLGRDLLGGHSSGVSAQGPVWSSARSGTGCGRPADAHRYARPSHRRPPARSWRGETFLERHAPKVVGNARRQGRSLQWPDQADPSAASANSGTGHAADHPLYHHPRRSRGNGH